MTSGLAHTRCQATARATAIRKKRRMSITLPDSDMATRNKVGEKNDYHQTPSFLHGPWTARSQAQRYIKAFLQGRRVSKLNYRRRALACPGISTGHGRDTSKFLKCKSLILFALPRGLEPLFSP